MKKFRKLIVALLAMAMVIGCFAVQASAADPVGVGENNPIIITFHFKKPTEWEKVYVKACIGDNWEYPEDNYKGYTGPDAESGLLVEDKNNAGWYTVTVSSEKAWGFNFIFADTAWKNQTKNIQTAYSMPAGNYEFWYTMDDEDLIVENCRLGLAEYKSLFGDETKTYVEMDSLAVAPDGWVAASDAEVVAEAEAVIDEAIALEATKANKAAYEAADSAYKALTDAQKKLVDAAKVEKVTAGLAAINKIIEEEQAAEDAKNAGTLTVYVKSPGWTAMNVYGWDGAQFGDWPGKALTALKANEGWFSVSFDITKATNLIFNDSKASGAEQTVNWEGVKAGTYWLVLSEKNDEGKYLVDALSTKAPEGWKEEEAEKIEQELPKDITTVTQEEIDAIKDSVKVEGSDDKLVVSPLIATSKDVDVITEALSKELKDVKFVVADLKFESGKQPTAGTKITIDVTKMADVKAAKFVAVYSVKDAKLELVDTVEVKDGKITFAPKHFSTYVFAEATDPKSDPDSGIVNTAVIVSAIAMLAAATVIVASKKRVTE